MAERPAADRNIAAKDCLVGTDESIKGSGGAEQRVHRHPLSLPCSLMPRDPDRSTHDGQNTAAMAAVSCVFCRGAIEPSRQTYYVLSCNCATCSDCLVDEHAKRGPFQLRCRCKKVVTSHRIQRAAPATANPSSSSEAEVVTYPEQLHPKDELRVSEAVQEFRSRTEKKEGDCALALHLSVFSWNEGAKKIEYLSQCKTRL